MKYLALLLMTIVPMAISMEKRSMAEFYVALKQQDPKKALAILKADKNLANADFTQYCKADNDETGDHETPLLSSICDNNFSLELFQALLEAGANVNKSAQSKQTPLIKSIFVKKSEIALALLDRNADTWQQVELRKDLRYDALDLAKSMKLTIIIKKIEEVRKTKQPSTTKLHVTFQTNK